MAIGRISGSVLKSNLTRSGVDLAFETNLLYLDVTNDRVGIGTSEPLSTFHVQGETTLGGTLSVSGETTLSGLTYPTSDGTPGQAIITDGSGNLSFTTISTDSLNTGQILIENNSVTGTATNQNIIIDPHGTGAIQVNSSILPGTTDSYDLGSSSVKFQNMHLSGNVVTANGTSQNWSTAYSWGNHADVGYLTNETVTSLSLSTNILTYVDENGNETDIDLSLYIDDTNLARLTSGTIDAETNIATFTRDDGSTFTVDMSSLTTDLNSVSSDDISEGDVNLYYTDDRVQTYLNDSYSITKDKHNKFSVYNEFKNISSETIIDTISQNDSGFSEYKILVKDINSGETELIVASVIVDANNSPVLMFTSPVRSAITLATIATNSQSGDCDVSIIPNTTSTPTIDISFVKTYFKNSYNTHDLENFKYIQPISVPDDSSWNTIDSWNPANINAVEYTLLIEYPDVGYLDTRKVSVLYHNTSVYISQYGNTQTDVASPNDINFDAVIDNGLVYLKASSQFTSNVRAIGIQLASFNSTNTATKSEFFKKTLITSTATQISSFEITSASLASYKLLVTGDDFSAVVEVGVVIANNSAYFSYNTLVSNTVDSNITITSEVINETCYLYASVDTGSCYVSGYKETLHLPPSNNNIVTIESDQTISGDKTFSNVSVANSLVLPNWTTDTRPASPQEGTVGLNTTTSRFEGYNGSAWVDISL